MKPDALNTFVRKRWYLPLGSVVAVTLAAIALRPRPITVQTAVVDRGSVRRTIVDEARTRMRETYVVSAPLAGRLLRVGVEPGDVVKKDMPLAKMTRGSLGFLDARTDAGARATVTSARARLQAAIAEREFATVEYQRASQLADSKLLAARTVDTARTQLRAARAAQDAAQADLKRAESALLEAGRSDSDLTIALRAPVAGVVLRVLQESEAVVAAGDAIVVLGDPTSLDVVAEYLSQDAVHLRVGHRASIERWSTEDTGGDSIAAQIERIEPIARTKVSALGIEEQRTRVVLRFLERIPDALRAHDYRVDARIFIAEVASTVRVPIGALFRDGARWSVFVMTQDRARLRHVELGLRDEHFGAIVKGLTAGERVIVYPNREISDGTRVAELLSPSRGEQPAQLD